MQIYAETFDEYLNQIPEDRHFAMSELRRVLLDKLPKGFNETFAGGFINYVVPLSLFPAGYHCSPETPLPFISIASQKNSINLYHMGIYSSPNTLKWFQDEWQKVSTRKLDMGKSCIRFKKPAEIPFNLIGELATKITPQNWIETYERNLNRKK